MPPQKRGAPLSTDEGSCSVEEAQESTKRPCRIHESSRSDARSLAPSPDCNMMNDGAWWLLPQRRTARNATTTTTHELPCRICLDALVLPSNTQALGLDEQSSLKHHQHSTEHTIDQNTAQRPSVTLLNFYKVLAIQEAALAGRNKNTIPNSSSSSREMMPSSVGISRTESANQCSYCDRTDQCRNCTARCDTCGLVFCSFCRMYSAQGSVVCLVCRSDLSSSSDEDVPKPPNSSAWGGGCNGNGLNCGAATTMELG